MAKRETHRASDSVESIRAANRMRDYPQEDVSVFLKEYRNPYMITPHLHTEYEIYYNINGGKGFFIDDHSPRGGRRSGQLCAVRHQH